MNHLHLSGFKNRKSFKRNYAAAGINRLTNSWTITPQTSDATLKDRLRILRARSREQYENNDYARRFINLLKSNVLGPLGISLQAKIKDPNGTADIAADNAVETAWGAWGRRNECDISHRLSWRAMQKLFLSTAAIDGEVLIRKIRGRSAGRFGFALQFLDPELLDVTYEEKLTNGNFIKMGIEFDSWTRPVAYYLRDGNSYQRRYNRVSADEIIHEFIPERVDQKRGIPWMSTALQRMQMLGGYEEAALVAARAGAAKMGFYTTPTGEEYQGDDNDDGNIITDFEAGVLEQLPKGTDFTAFDPTYPHQQFADFMKTSLRGIASGLGVSYNPLANDLEGVNFSSIRTGVLEDRELWKELQEWMIEVFARPVYEEWLHFALLRQEIIILNGKSLDPLREKKYQQVRFQGRRWAWVDPKKDIETAKIAIDERLRSRSDIIRETGRDPQDVFDEIKKEQSQLPVLPDTGGNNAKTQTG